MSGVVSIAEKNQREQGVCVGGTGQFSEQGWKERDLSLDLNFLICKVGIRPPTLPSPGLLLGNNYGPFKLWD